MNKNTVKRSCTAGIPDFLPRQKDQKNQVQQKEDMWPEINPWNVMFSVLGTIVSAIPDSRTETETVYYYRDNNY
ncbi:hypothetical protein NKB77_005295 [Salmonella enterica]|nr:hypothetical protein [Salmonella enterica]